MLIDRRAPAGKTRIIGGRPYNDDSQDRVVGDYSRQVAVDIADKHNNSRSAMSNDEVYLVYDDQGNYISEATRMLS